MTTSLDSQRRDANNSRLPRVELEILRGRARNKLRRIDVPVFLIGSAKDCDMVLADSAFPEVHTYVYVNASGVTVRRLGEGPELSIDGKLVQASAVHDGQTLRIGQYEFAVHITPAEASQPVERQPLVRFALSDFSHNPVTSIATVRAFLDDVRTSLRTESSLNLYVEQERPWQAVTAGKPLIVEKVTA